VRESGLPRTWLYFVAASLSRLEALVARLEVSPSRQTPWVDDHQNGPSWIARSILTHWMTPYWPRVSGKSDVTLDE
jgi:hypothetical protein